MKTLSMRAWIAAGVTLLVAVSPAAAQTSVTQCGTTITSPGQYQLDWDLVCTGDGVIILANNIEFDLKGHTLSIADVNQGGPYAGIRIGPWACPAPTTMADVTIRNGTVSGFGAGVWICSATRVRATGLQILTGTFGISSVFTTNSTFDANQISGELSPEATFTGISMLSGGGNKVLMNQIVHSIGVEVGLPGAGGSSNQNQVVDNELSNNSRALTVHGSDNLIAHNKVGTSAWTANGIGIGIAAGTRNYIGGNLAKLNDIYDLADNSTPQGCGGNIWVGNTFKTANKTCIQ